MSLLTIKVVSPSPVVLTNSLPPLSIKNSYFHLFIREFTLNISVAGLLCLLCEIQLGSLVGPLHRLNLFL